MSKKIIINGIEEEIFSVEEFIQITDQDIEEQAKILENELLEINSNTNSFYV